MKETNESKYTRLAKEIHNEKALKLADLDKVRELEIELDELEGVMKIGIYGKE